VPLPAIEIFCAIIAFRPAGGKTGISPKRCVCPRKRSRFVLAVQAISRLNRVDLDQIASGPIVVVSNVSPKRESHEPGPQLKVDDHWRKWPGGGVRDKRWVRDHVLKPSPLPSPGVPAAYREREKIAMAIRFNCECGKKLSAPDFYAGREGKCNHCGKRFVIPGEPKPAVDETISQPMPAAGVGVLTYQLNPKAAAKVGVAYNSAYSSSKAAVLGFTRSIARETAQLGITVNSVCPWHVDTEMMRESMNRRRKMVGKQEDEYLAEIGFPVKELGTRFQRGTGCDQCRQTGYQGRAAIYEICLITEPLRKLIMRKRDGGELKQCAIAEGMETLRQDGWRRVAHGKTTIEEVVRVTQTDEVMAETTEAAEPMVAG